VLAELVADVANEPGSLPLLQYALTELYERREGTMLTANAYRAIGGVSGALAGRAEEIYSGLAEPAQEAARQLFLRLVTLGEGTEDTRRRVERTELAAMEVDQDALEAAIQEFGAWRLLSFDRDPRSGTPTIEVAHEALIREWGRFRRWIDSGREQVRLHRRLSAAAREWEGAAREPSYLLRGSNLAQFESLADESTIALTEVEREFVDASREANELELARERRHNRRLKTVLAVALALLLLAVVAGALALVSRSNAQHEAQVALGRELGAEAVSEPRIDLAALLANESLRLDDSEATQGTLLTTLLRSPAAIGTFALPPTERPQNVQVAPDGRTIAVRTNSNLIRIYDTRTHRQVRSLPALPGDYLYLPHTQRLFLLNGNQAGIEYQMVDAATGRVIRVFSLDHRLLSAAGTSAALPVAATDDGRYVFLAYALQNKDGSDGPAYLDRWAVGRGGTPVTIPLRTRGMLAMTVTRAGRLLVASDDAIAAWDPATLQRDSVVSIRLPEAPAAFSPDGSVLAYGLTDGTLHFVDTANGRVTPGSTAHAGAVGAIAFSSNGRLAVSGGDEGVAIVWNPRTGQPLERLSGHATAIHDVAFSQDGRTVYTSSLDGTVLQWDLGGHRRFGRSFTVAPWPPAAFMAPPLAVSPDGTSFAALDGASGIAIYSTATLERTGSLTVPQRRRVTSVAWSGDRLAVGDDHGTVRVFTVARSSRLLRILPGLRAPVVSVAATDKGRIVAAAAVAGSPGQLAGPTHGTLVLWRDGRPTGHPVPLHGITLGAAVDLAFSRDGSQLAVAARNGPVLIVDPRTARVLRTIRPSRSDTAIAVAFAANGTLATTSWAGILTLWNPDTGTQIGHPTPVGSGPGSLSFDPTGRIIAIAGDAVRLWSAGTEQQLGSALPGPAQPEWTHVAFTPDGRYLFVVPADGTAWRWPATPTQWAEHACAVAGRNFTHEEWHRFVGARAYSRVCPQFPAGR
jgi:WD40 repeat protein